MTQNQFPSASASGAPGQDGTGATFDPNASGVVPQSKLDQLRAAAVSGVEQGAEWPKMIYPEDEDGNCQWGKGVTVGDELEEKRVRSIWADKSGKQAAAINAEASKRRQDSAKQRLEAEAKATREAAENRAKGGSAGPGDGMAEHTAHEQAAADLLAPKVAGDAGSPTQQAPKAPAAPAAAKPAAKP